MNGPEWDLVDAFLVGVLLYCVLAAIISTADWYWLAAVGIPIIYGFKKGFFDG